MLDSCWNSRILEDFSNIDDPMIPPLNPHKTSRKSLPVHGGNACFKGCFVGRKAFHALHFQPSKARLTLGVHLCFLKPTALQFFGQPLAGAGLGAEHLARCAGKAAQRYPAEKPGADPQQNLLCLTKCCRAGITQHRATSA